MTLTAGSVGIDYSSARPSLTEAVNSGATFVLRYSAGAANHPNNPSHAKNADKLITPGEFAELIAAGLDVIANSEWYETRITEGAAAGDEDAAADLALWRSCGLAEGSSIYVSWDASPDPGQWPAVDAYLQAYEARLHGYYHADCYAGTPYLHHAKAANIVRYGWRPNAGSWSNDGLPYQPADHGRPLLGQARDSTLAAIWQTGNWWFGQNADEDLILRVPCGSHRQQSHPPAPPPPPPHWPDPKLHRPWPSYMPRDEYFGLITGPPQSHGGYYDYERPDVKAIQQELIRQDYVPGHSDPNDGWADGIFQPPTADAVTRFQHAKMPGTQFYGQVWWDDWTKLFSY